MEPLKNIDEMLAKLLKTEEESVVGEFIKDVFGSNTSAHISRNGDGPLDTVYRTINNIEDHWGWGKGSPNVTEVEPTRAELSEFKETLEILDKKVDELKMAVNGAQKQCEASLRASRSGGSGEVWREGSMGNRRSASARKIKAESVTLSPEKLAQISDKALDDVYHYGLSKPGSFGYEANKSSAQAVVDAYNQGISDLEELSAAVHEGWSSVAKTFDDPVYQTKPQKKEARLKLANTKYESLPEEEKEKDRVVARAVLAEIEQ
jgi:hypothetical protein